MGLLAYKFTFSPSNVRLITNDKNIFKKLMRNERLFFVANSKEAVDIIRHDSFKTD